MSTVCDGFATEFDRRRSKFVTRPLELLPLLLQPGQQKPQHEDDRKERQDDRLQHSDALGLRNGADGEREYGGTHAAKGRREADGRDVQVARQEARGDDDGGGEEGAEKEALEGDGDS